MGRQHGPFYTFGTTALALPPSASTSEALLAGVGVIPMAPKPWELPPPQAETLRVITAS